jgi:hypothetical protein
MVFKNFRKKLSVLAINIFLSVIILPGSLVVQSNCSRPPEADSAKYDTGKNIKIIGEITDIFKFPKILMDDSRIYLWDKFLCKVCIYSKNDLQKITEFGKKGAGPAEFNPVIHNVCLTNNYIYVSAFPKICCFSKDGKFIKEMKGRTLAGSYLAIGENFIGQKNIYTGPKNKKDKIVFILFDSNLRKMKDIFETEFLRKSTGGENSKIKLLWFSGCRKGVVYKDRFYVGATERGFYFAVFDENGNKLYEIDKKYEHTRISNEFKKTMFNWIDKAQNMEGFRRFVAKREIVFPDYFPAYCNFAVDNERIYVFKYPQQFSSGAVLEVVVLDLKGNLLEQKSLPASFWNGFELDTIYLYNGKLYLIEMSTKNENLDLIEVSL